MYLHAGEFEDHISWDIWKKVLINFQNFQEGQRKGDDIIKLIKTKCVTYFDKFFDCLYEIRKTPHKKIPKFPRFSDIIANVVGKQKNFLACLITECLKNNPEFLKAGALQEIANYLKIFLIDNTSIGNITLITDPRKHPWWECLREELGDPALEKKALEFKQILIEIINFF